MTYLLDVNILIALVDPTHVAHDLAHDWFDTEGSADWATCPTTENGLLRILGNVKYANSAGSPAAVAPILTGLRAHSGHRFWADDISLVNTPGVNTAMIRTSGQMTDTYLLALAVAHGGALATLDRRLSPVAVAQGAKHLRLVAAD